MILGHVTTTFMLHSLAERKRPMPPFGLVLAGALLPDVMDKTIAMTELIAFYPGRGIFHSLAVDAAVFAAAWMFCAKRRAAAWAVFIGVSLHLVQDTPGLKIVLWPLLGPWDFEVRRSIWEKVVTLYIGMEPLHFWIGEMAGAAYCAFYFMAVFIRRARA